MSRKSANTAIEEYVRDNEGGFVQVLYGFGDAKTWDVTIFPPGTTDSFNGTGDNMREALDVALENLGRSQAEFATPESDEPEHDEPLPAEVRP